MLPKQKREVITDLTDLTSTKNEKKKLYVEKNPENPKQCQLDVYISVDIKCQKKYAFALIRFELLHLMKWSMLNLIFTVVSFIWKMPDFTIILFAIICFYFYFQIFQCLTALWLLLRASNAFSFHHIFSFEQTKIDDSPVNEVHFIWFYVFNDSHSKLKSELKYFICRFIINAIVCADQYSI